MGDADTDPGLVTAPPPARPPWVQLAWSLPLGMIASWWFVVIAGVAYCLMGVCEDSIVGSLGYLGAAVGCIALPITLASWDSRRWLRAVVGLGIGTLFVAATWVWLTQGG